MWVTTTFLRYRLGLLFLSSLKITPQQNYLYIKKINKSIADSWCIWSLFEVWCKQVWAKKTPTTDGIWYKTDGNDSPKYKKGTKSWEKDAPWDDNKISDAAIAYIYIKVVTMSYIELVTMSYIELYYFFIYTLYIIIPNYTLWGSYSESVQSQARCQITVLPPSCSPGTAANPQAAPQRPAMCC